MTVRKSVDALREDLSAVKSDLAALTSELASLAQAGTQEAKDRLFARIAVLQSQASVLQDHIRQSLDEGVNYLDDQVHAKPYQAAIVAGVVGGVLAWLITRPRD